MTTRVADLHTHTYYSDGTWTPAELLRHARQRGLTTLAVTDHDTVQSTAEARIAAAAEDIELIPGIELSTEHAGQDIHILGYYFDVENADLITWLENVQSQRERRLELMVARMRDLDVDITVQAVRALAGPGTIGRLHVARALVACGAISHTKEAFTKYIGTNGPAFIEEHHPTPVEAIRCLREAGGVPVLAHPAFLKDARVVPELVDAGLLGIEVYHSGHDAGDKTDWARIAQEHQLLMTGGSDCHGMAKGKPLLGSVKLDYRYVEALKACPR